MTTAQERTRPTDPAASIFLSAPDVLWPRLPRRNAKPCFPLLRPARIVFHPQGWRTHAVVTPEEIRRLPRFDGVPLTAYLSVLGGTGDRLCGPDQDRPAPGGRGPVHVGRGQSRHGDRTVRQLLGAGRLVGSTGSAAKAAHLIREVGYDTVFDYHDGPALDLLAKAAPDGIDVFVDNVGGEQLAAAVGALREFGRVVRVGTISQYNTATAPEPRTAPVPGCPNRGGTPPSSAPPCAGPSRGIQRGCATRWLMQCGC